MAVRTNSILVGSLIGDGDRINVGISEIKIYNRTLNSTEIQDDLNNYNSYLTRINL